MFMLWVGFRIRQIFALFGTFQRNDAIWVEFESINLNLMYISTILNCVTKCYICLKVSFLPKKDIHGETHTQWKAKRTLLSIVWTIGRFETHTSCVLNFNKCTFR